MRTATFLSADRRLTKAYYADGRSEPYPLVRDFSSFEVEYSTIEELKEAMELAGSAGACMLKGSLSKQIHDEPRIGLTDPNANTNLLVLDYDSDGGFIDIPDLLSEIDPSLTDTDYIFQHSASSGITGKSGIRGHVFILLSEPVSPNVLKQWLKKINLSSRKFRERIKLSRNAVALCYALDITICQNDKLVYIAPPKLVDMEDPISERFSLHKGESRTYTFNSAVSAEVNRTKEHQLIENLQDAGGLTKRTPKYKAVGDYEILTNPANCVVSDTKDCGKFVRVNLNGGDSFAYWYAKDNPDVLHNFKGEPAVYLRDIAPEYYGQIQRQQQPASMRPFVFRDVEANVYYNAEYDEGTNQLGICFPSSRPALNDFMIQRGSPIAKSVPDWQVMFDPTIETSVEFAARKLNLYRPSEYMKNAEPDDTAKFPVIQKVLQHICVDQPTYEHFIKWVAHIVQFRTKTQTAWVFAGTEGCLSGDTLINLTRGKRHGMADRPRTMKDIYQKWSGICDEKRTGSGNGFKPFDRSITPTQVMSCKDGLSVGPHEVYDIYESGVRPLWELTTNTGRSIKATKEHPFMRPDKSMTPMEQLVVGDTILVQGDRLLNKSNNGRKKTRVVVHSIPHHPYAWQHMVSGKNYKRSHKSRLVYEAEMNGLSYETFLHIIRHEPDRASKLMYLSSEEIIHHLDEDETNDSISNLVAVDKLNHDQHHARSTGLGTHPIIEETVVSVEYVGEEMTYDMTMKAPYHNYVANGFVVSNTGKGTMFHRILTPILGEDHTFLITQDQADEQFNGYLKANMLLFLDEGDSESSKQAERMLGKFRSIITEPRVPIRMMRANTTSAENYTNLIIATNKSLPIKITSGDRRYNVAPRQNTKLQITPTEYNSIPNELHAFTSYLKAQQIGVMDSTIIMQSTARDELIDLSKTVADDFFDSLKFGNLDFFAEQLLDTTPVNDPNYIAFARIVQEWMRSAGVEQVVPIHDVFSVYKYVSGNDKITDKRFGHLASRQELIAHRVRVKGLVKRAFKLNFKPGDYTEWLDRNKASVIPLHGVRNDILHNKA